VASGTVVAVVVVVVTGAVLVERAVVLEGAVLVGAAVVVTAGVVEVVVAKGLAESSPQAATTRAPTRIAPIQTRLMSSPRASNPDPRCG
jgi:hypothetical protein